MAYDNNLSGVLFRNQKKEHDKQPDYKGNAEIDGTQYWISGWLRESEKVDGKFLSLKFEEKDAAKKGNGKSTRNPDPADDDDIPF